MHRSAQGWQTWRRLTACLLICALFMHGIASAVSSAIAGTMSGAQPSADAVVPADWAGFEVCRHDGATPQPPGDHGRPGGDTHCVFCVSGSGFVLTPPSISTVFWPVEVSIAPLPLVAWRLPPATVDASARPRGPPPTA
jgi:Protein of unknown function (DUF2946)